MRRQYSQRVVKGIAVVLCQINLTSGNRLSRAKSSPTVDIPSSREYSVCTCKRTNDILCLFF